MIINARENLQSATINLEIMSKFWRNTEELLWWGWKGVETVGSFKQNSGFKSNKHLKIVDNSKEKLRLKFSLQTNPGKIPNTFCTSERR
jgi:hypothetical protein